MQPLITAQAGDDQLEAVRAEIASVLLGSPLCPLVQQHISQLTGGKMLRARLVLSVGRACHTPEAELQAAAVTVEMMHTASILHDDVVDGGRQRRGAPAFWVTHGPALAVLLGDILLSAAFSAIASTTPRAIPLLAETLRKMCVAEAEQELAFSGNKGTWGDCIRIAGEKTGSLFGFAASCAAGANPDLARHLQAAGTRLGIAYQLADDLLDAYGDPSVAGKTLGSDARDNKLTAARFLPQRDADPIHQLLAEASHQLIPWPGIQEAWDAYIENTLAPFLAAYARA
jgi:heptaprenyl diphosphate synthase